MLVLLLSTLFLASSLAAVTPMSYTEQQEPTDLIVFNRILAKVNEKTISVLDVMKKMDFFLQKNYPQFSQSKAARFQFYSTQWREYLSQMIDQELMLADAEHLEIKVTDAEVREEVMDRFGPNIMTTLDKIGLTYEEARQMIHDEMIVQRMIWFRVNSKALNTVNSQDVKDAYRQFCDKNPALEQWAYDVLSIRSKDEAISASWAKKARELLEKEGNLSAVAAQLAPLQEEEVVINCLTDLQKDEKTISHLHKEVLKNLSAHGFSTPVAQQSRVDQSIVYRIFHLKQHSKRKLPSLEKMADQLREELLHQAANKENLNYLTKLRERLGYDEKHMLETLPSDFQPFALR